MKTRFICSLTKTSFQYVWIYVIYNLIICYFISILEYCVTDLIVLVFPVLMVHVSYTVKQVKVILQKDFEGYLKK